MKRRAQGEGSVFFDKSKSRWVGTVDVGVNSNGNRRRVKVIGAAGESKSDVAARFRVRMAEVQNLAPTAPRTVGALVETWLAKAAPKRMEERTLQMVLIVVRNHLLPALGAIRVSALTVEDVEAWLEENSKRLAKSSVIKLRSYLAQAFDFGIRLRHATWNPARVAEMPAGTTDSRQGRALTASEAKALLGVAEHHRYGAWVTVALTLGLRPGEVSGLKWEAIDPEARTVTVYQSLGWTKTEPEFKPTKTGKTRILELPTPTVDALRRHRASHAEERLMMGGAWPLKWWSLVFVTTNGLPLGATHLRRIVDGMAKAAGISGSVTPYDLRHSATSLLSASGQSAEKLTDMLGHKDTRMVFKHYRHPVVATINTAVAYWEAATG